MFGHLDQTRKNIRSTKKWEISTGDRKWFFSKREENNNFVFSAKGIANPDTGNIYTDLNGRFPVPSNRAMQYMLILYAYDTNTILVDPIKTRSDAYMLHAYDVLYEKIENSGQAPKLNIIYNEAST